LRQPIEPNVDGVPKWVAFKRSAAFQQQSNERRMAAVRCEGENRVTMIVPSVKVSAFFDEQSIETPDFKYSHSITPDARFGLDDEGGLVWVRFRTEEANASVKDFVSLIEAPIEDTDLG
jgi:hypothetical protein